MALYLGISDAGLLTSADSVGFIDRGAEKRIAERENFERIITSVASAVVAIVVSLIPGLGAGAASLFSSVVGTTVSKATALTIVSTTASVTTQTIGDAIGGNLDEDTGIAVGTDIAVGALTFGFGKAVSAAVDQIRFYKTANKFGKLFNSATGKTLRGEVLEEFAKAVKETSDAYLNPTVVKDSLNTVDNFIRKSIVSGQEGGVKGIVKTILSLISEYASKLIKKGLRGNKLIKAIQAFQKRILKRLQALLKPITKRLKLLKDRYKKIVGGDFVKKRIEDRKLEAYKNIKKESKNENNVKKMEDMNNYVVNELGVIPLSSEWLLGYKVNTGSNEEVATLAVYFKTQLFSNAKKKRKYRSMKATMYYTDVPLAMIEEFANSSSPGRWYLENLARGQWQSQSISVGNGLREKGKTGPAYGVAGQVAYTSILGLGVKTLLRNQQDKLKYWNRSKEIYRWVTKPYSQVESQLFKQAKKLF